MRAVLRILGLLAGIGLAAAALLGPQAAVDGFATTLGLGRLTPLAQPPLGQNARFALAAAGLVVGLLLAVILGQFARRGRTSRDQGSRDGAAPEMRYESAPLPAFAFAPDRARVSDPDLAGLPAEPIHIADLTAEPVAAMFATTHLETTDAIFEPVEPATHEPPIRVLHATMLPETLPTPEPPLHSGGPITVDPEPPRYEASTAKPIAPTDVMYAAAMDGSPPPANKAPRQADMSAGPVAVSDPAIADSLARVEAALHGLALHGPAPIAARLDAIDARMGQMAQQIAELAGLARMATRTPMPAPAAVAPFRAPDDPARRQSIGTAARALRERLERDSALEPS